MDVGESPDIPFIVVCRGLSKGMVPSKINLPPFYPVFALDTKDNCQHGVD